ncbi:MAG: C4-dicarboxylate ABC transporter substrate-binding protein [Gammaproteobacteria bacterium]|nr:MAG: C4-dicarboxylate ABC transporter substrate-binding protein [Gammaproteobacteria bacterium]
MVSDKKSRETGKDSIIAISFSIILVIAGFWTAFQFVEPAPPTHITISSGSEEGAYFDFSHRYQTLLAANGIELEILTSAGSSENIQRLLDGEVDIAFVQGGSSGEKSNDKLLSLGSLYYEPIWMFYRQPLTINGITDLTGKKIAIGPEGSGTRIVAKRLLEKNGFNENNAELLDLTGKESATALIDGIIDVLFLIASPDSDTIKQLLTNEQISLMSFERADAYTRLNPYLSRVTLPQGIVNLEKNIPEQEITLLAPTANLVIKEDFHPALSVLLLQAATQIHQTTTLFSKKGTFPNAQNLEFPISEQADRFYKKGPPFLMRFLPFWAAILIDRMVVMIIPVFALLFPLFKIMPPLYRWRIRSRIYRWYRELQIVDDQQQNQVPSEQQQQAMIKELERIESEVNKVKTPLSYADQVYNLLLHIDLVRKKILKMS